MTLLYVILLLIAFYFLLVAEFLLPTGGMSATAAVAVLIAAIVIAFSHSLLAGTAVIIFVLLTVPLVLMLMVRVWPHTPIGKRMLNLQPGERAEAIPCRTTPRGVPVDELIGCLGIAKTDLLPSGTVVMNGEKLDVVSTGMPIDAGTQVIVTNVDLGRLHVRAATDADLQNAGDSTPRSPLSLEGSIDTLDAG